MIRRSILWLDDRLGIAPFLSKALKKAFPDHWSFMLGEIALYSFLALLATGIYLGLLFDPSSGRTTYSGPYTYLNGTTISRAYASALRISFEVPAGLVIRQIHHWSALIFIAAIVCHMIRIFFTAAFRKPRELNWLIGVTLLLLALAAGFTGYSLPDDLLSGTGLRIAVSVALSIPVIGAWLASLAFGGPFPAPDMESRLFFTHVLLVPAVIMGLIGLHLAIVWRQKHTQFRGPRRTESNVIGSPLWPNYTLKSIALACAVFAVVSFLGGFFQINPIWKYGAYDPALVASPSQPDWYVGWLEGALRLGPAWEIHLFHHLIPSPFIPAVLTPLLLFGLIYLWPFIERAFSKDHASHNVLDYPVEHPWRTSTGVAVLALFVVLTLAGADDVEATFLHVPVEALVTLFRICVFAAPIVAWLITFELCRELRARASTDAFQAPPSIELVRTKHGGSETRKRRTP